MAAPALSIQPRVVGAVSAGAAMACMLFSGAVATGIARFQERSKANQKNVYLGNLLTQYPVFPHAAMYHSAILDTLDQAALERLQSGPDVRVLLARLPGWLGPRSGVLTGFAAYQLERLLTNRVHPVFARRVGFRPEVVSVRQCATPDDVADLVLQSSCSPPFTPVYRRDSRAVLDGGLIDNVPIEAVVGSAPTLVLLTRCYPKHLIPTVAGRTYVQPSRPIQIRKWDYTNPQGMQATYDLGQRDAERFVESMTSQRAERG